MNLIKKNFLFTFFIAVFSFSLFAEIKVISPVEGNWANKQMLVIDTSDGADYFYSLNGSDPTMAGFAYDGPVLLDITGQVNLKISKGFVDSETKEISFSVNPSRPLNVVESDFVDSFFDFGIVNYFYGDEISIPNTMQYCFVERGECFVKGQKLKCSEYCSFSRFVPCVVKNEDGLFWRFVIKTIPKSTGAYSRRDLPISIRDWENISFNDNSLIYKIDDGFWSLPKTEMKIDRSVSHIIYWQSLEYENGNPIDFCALPPKPELKKSTNSDGSVNIYIDGDESYSMGNVEIGTAYQPLYTELCADVFFGECLKDEIEVAVYSDSFYQGRLSIDYEVDKLPPPEPMFSSYKPNVYIQSSHGDLALKVYSSYDTELFVAVSEPFILDEINISAYNNPERFNNVITEDFKNCGNSIDFLLKPIDGNPTFYKVSAYSSRGSNTSEIVDYMVIVDNYDFYLNSNADSSLADGSRAHPFTSFSQFFDEAKNYRSVNLFVFGNLTFPEGKTEISFNCNIKGDNDAVLQFPKGSSIVVRNSTLQISDCRLESDNRTLSRNVPTSLIKLEYAVLDMDNVEFASFGAKNNTVIDASKSVVSLKNSFFSVTATTYASLLSSVDTRIDIKSCKIGIVSDTAVAFSVRGSDFAMKDSFVNVTGTIGRVSEFFGVTAKVESNEFKADLKKGGKDGAAVYSDKKSNLDEIYNSVTGF